MSTRERIPGWIVPLLLPALVLALFSPSLRYDFAPLDDDVNIVFNPNQGPPTAERIVASFRDTRYIRRYQPLGWILNQVAGSISGLAPWGYHLVNVGLHAVNALLLYAVLRRLVRRFSGGEPGTANLSLTLAPALAAAWWALHPLRVETTAWVSALPTNLALGLTMLAVWLHLGADTPRRVALAALAFTAALLSYPVGMGAAVFFPLLDWAGGRRGRALVARALPFFVAAGIVGVLNLAARAGVSAEHAPLPSLATLPFGVRLLRGCCFLAHYWWKPWLPFDLAPAYGELLHITWTSRYVVAGAVLAVALAVLIWQVPAAGLLLVGQVAVLAPITGLTELLHFPHDRYALWADLAWAAGLALLLARWRSRSAMIAFATVVAGAAALTARQLPTWAGRDTVAASIRSHLAPGEATPVRDVRPAYWLFRDGHYRAAFALLDRELATRPDDVSLRTARHDLQEMLAEHVRIAAEMGLTPEQVPPVARIHAALARECLAKGDHDVAAWHLVEIARLSPDYYALLQHARPGK